MCVGGQEPNSNLRHVYHSQEIKSSTKVPFYWSALRVIFFLHAKKIHTKIAHTKQNHKPTQLLARLRFKDQRIMQNTAPLLIFKDWFILCGDISVKIYLEIFLSNKSMCV